jgi:excisionase family DNA binding protein
MDNVFVKLCEIAEMTGLPRASLRRLAHEGKIPSLRLSRGLRFNPAAVEKALAFLASGAEQSGTEGAVGGADDAGKS